MKRLMMVPVLAALVGCVVVVNDDTKNTRRPAPPPPHKPPTPPPVVQVSWTDCRTVILREYFDCDWDLIGTFEFYETRHGIPEDDLLVLLYISRLSGVNFHEVVYSYERFDGNLMATARRHRLAGNEFFIDVARGTTCPYDYENAYTLYWKRGAIALTNSEVVALFWLKLSVHYFGFTIQEAFGRWETCGTKNVRYVEVCREEYQRCGRGGRSYTDSKACVTTERPWVKAETRVIIEKQRTDSCRQAETEIQIRIRSGHPTPPTPSETEARRRREEAARRAELERRAAEEEALRRRRASVSVSWVETRTVILREYFECDWKLVGTFEYYETHHGIQDEDLLVLLYISRHSSADFHEVVYHYRKSGGSLYATAGHYRMTGLELFVDLPQGTACSAAYSNAYAAYWKRRVTVLTNDECRALVWLKVSVNYYGWTAADHFRRWDTTTTRSVRYSEVCREEYDRCGVGGKTVRATATATAERPWTKPEVKALVERNRTENIRHAEAEIQVRVKAGKPVAESPRDEDLRKRREENARREEAERRAADEEARRREIAAAEAARKRQEALDRAEEEAKRNREADEARRAQEEQRRKAVEERRAKERAEEERRRQEDEVRKAEDVRRNSEEQKRAEEKKRAAEEAKRRADEEKRAADKKRADDEAKRRAEDQKRAEEKRIAEEEARRKAEEERDKQPNPSPRPEPRTDEEKLAATRTLITDLSAAIHEYKALRKEFPAGSIADVARKLQEKKHPAKAEVFFTFEAWMLDANGNVIDAYGRNLVYRENSRNYPRNKNDRNAHNKETFDLCSMGPDGRAQQGGGDDLANWTAAPVEDKDAEEKKKAEEEKKRKAAEEQKRIEDEKRKAADEEKRKNAEKNKAAEEEARRAAEEKAKADAEKKKADEEEKRKNAEKNKQAEEEARKANEDKRKAEDEKRKADAEKRKAAEDEARRAAEEKAKADARRKAEEKQKAEEAARKAAEEKKKAEDEERKRKEEEARKAAEEKNKQPPPPPAAGKTPTTDEEKLAATRKLVSDLNAAIHEHKKLRKEFPAGGIAEVAKKLAEKKEESKKDTFFTFEEWMLKDGIIVDAYGNALVYRDNSKDGPSNLKNPKIHNKKGFDLYSCGADGKAANGDGDDITNWK